MEFNEFMEQRRKTHGDFVEFAKVSQELKELVRSSPNWPDLSDVQREVLEMIAHKMARILTGHPDFADHWADLAGYSHRAEERCSDYKEKKDGN